MLPSNHLRFAACSLTGIPPPIFYHEPPASATASESFEDRSGLSPSEVVKRKLHQRLMAGQAKKRRLSEAVGPPPPHSEPLLPGGPQTSIVDATDAESTGAETRNEEVERKAVFPGGESSSSTEESRGNSICTGGFPDDSGLRRAFIRLEASNTGEEQVNLIPCVGGKGRCEDFASADKVNERSADERMSALEDSTMKKRSGWSKNAHSGIGRLEDSVDKTKPLAMVSTPNLSDVRQTSSAPSVTVAPFPASFSTTKTSVSAGTVHQSAISSAEELVFSLPVSGDVDPENSLVRRNTPTRTALEGVAKETELHKTSKKKSRRTPKVKKIKFHEYKGPHRRALTSKSKSIGQTKKVLAVETTDQTRSLHLPLCTLNNVNSSNIAINLIPQNFENSVRLLQNSQRTEDTMMPFNLLTSHQVKDTINEKERTNEADRLTCLLRFDNRNCLLDPGFRPSAPMNSLLLQADNTNGVLNSSSCVVNPLVQSIAKAGTSAPLLVTSASKRKEKPSKTGSRLDDDRKLCRKSSTVLTAPVTLDDLKVAELKQECKMRKLSVTGPKSRLVNRLSPFSDTILEQRCLPPVEAYKYLPPSNGKSHDLAENRPFPMLKMVHELPPAFPHKTPSNANHKAPSIGARNAHDDEDDDDDDNDEDDDDDDDEDGSAWSPCSNSLDVSSCAGPKCSRAEGVDSTQVGCVRGEEHQRKLTVTTSPGSCSMTSVTDFLTKTTYSLFGQSINQTVHAKERPETDICKVHQQLLTPPATPTLVSNHGVGHSQCEAVRPAPTGTTPGEIVAVGKNDVGIYPGNSRWLYHVTSNGAPVTLTDSELWLIQEKQIADLEHQLQKSKVELTCARRKVYLENCNDFLPLGALIKSGASECEVPKCMSEEAQLALSSAIENAQRTFFNLKRRCCLGTDGNPPDGNSPSANTIAETDSRLNDDEGACQKDRTVVFDCENLRDLDLTCKRLNTGNNVAIDTNFLTKTIKQEVSSPDLKGHLCRSLSSDIRKMTVPLVIEGERDFAVQHSCYSTPIKKPPDYYEAVRQKLLQTREAVASELAQSGITDGTVSGANSSIEVTTAPTLAAPKEEEEIEDVLEVLLRSGELSCNDLQTERLLWHQDSVENFPLDFLSSRHRKTELSSEFLLKGLRSTQQRCLLTNLRPYWMPESDICQAFSCSTDLKSNGPFDPKLEISGSRISRVTGCPSSMVSKHFGTTFTSKEFPPETEDSDFLFDWNNVEPNLKSSTFHLLDSYPSPGESIICPISNRDAIVSDSVVNGGSSDWKGNSISDFLIEDWNAATPCNSANSSVCNSTNGDDAMTGEHQDMVDRSPGILSPGMTPASANITNEVETEPLFRLNDFIRDSPNENEWMEVFMDSENFPTPAHLMGNSSSNLLPGFTFPQGFFLGENGQSHLVQ